MGEMGPRQFWNKVARRISVVEFALKVWAGFAPREALQQCPLCQGTVFVPHGGRRQALVLVKIVRCQRCGFLAQSPRLSPRSLKTFYEKYYRLTLNVKLSESTFIRGQRRGKYQLDFIQSAAPYFAPRMASSQPGAPSVLEVGSGDGGILRVFKNAGFEVRGCEWDPQARVFANQKDIPTVESDEDLNQESFDLVILSHVLEHVADLSGFLRSIAKRLKPGGFLYIEVPGIRHPKKEWQSAVELGHLWYFSHDSLTRLLSSHGFTEISGNETVQALFCIKKN